MSITTISGTYTIEQYNEICMKVANAFVQYWNGVIDWKHLERVKRESGLKDAEIKSIQRDASRIFMKNIEYLKGVV